MADDATALERLQRVLTMARQLLDNVGTGTSDVRLFPYDVAFTVTEGSDQPFAFGAIVQQDGRAARFDCVDRPRFWRGPGGGRNRPLNEGILLPAGIDDKTLASRIGRYVLTSIPIVRQERAYLRAREVADKARCAAMRALGVASDGYIVIAGVPFRAQVADGYAWLESMHGLDPEILGDLLTTLRSAGVHVAIDCTMQDEETPQ